MLRNVELGFVPAGKKDPKPGFGESFDYASTHTAAAAGDQCRKHISALAREFPPMLRNAGVAVNACPGVLVSV